MTYRTVTATRLGPPAVLQIVEHDVRFAWTTYRNPREPDARDFYSGFRVVCPVP